MRIVGKINKIKGEKAEFFPLDVFPEDTKYFKRIKNKKIEIDNENFEEGEIFVLDEDLSHRLLYKNLKNRKDLIFIPERAKNYGVLENEYIKILIDPEKGGKLISLFDKNKGFEWFFSDFVYVYGKFSECGISQGISEKNLYEKKLKFEIGKNRFYGKRKEKEFVFEKIIEICKNKINFLIKMDFKKGKKFYPFFDVKVFTGDKIYSYYLKIKKDGKIMDFPCRGYPFWGWGYNEEFGKVDEVVYINNKCKLIIKPERKRFLNFSFSHGLNYFLNRFYYKEIKKKFEIKLEVKV